MKINPKKNNYGYQLIRFGIMCNGNTLQSWQASCLNHLLSLDNVRLALIIIDDNVRPLGFFDKIKSFTPNYLLFILYKMFFCKPPCEESVDVSNVFSQIPSIRCKVIKKGRFSQYFNEADIETIRGNKLDFILRFGFNIIRGEILNVARFGVWSFHHDDEQKYKGCPPCFWEIYMEDNITGAILQRLTDRLDGGIILKKGFFKTINFSYSKNLNAVYFESANWPTQVCIDINNSNVDYLNNAPSQTSAPVFNNPRNFQMILFVVKIIKNQIVKIYNNLFRHDQWNIGIINTPIYSFVKSGIRPKVHWLPKPKNGKFLADPFGVIKNNKLNILCENFDYRYEKANILNIEFSKECIIKRDIAFDLPFHVSYPYLFEYREENYCIIESSSIREISLYKAEKFPHKWIKVTTIIKDILCSDATVFQYEGRWWLTCTEVDRNPNLNLFVWYAPDFLGPWKPHANNPVKTDVRSSRPAGTPFIHNNHLYRPAQDCSKTYGGRILFNRITKLSPTEFKEEQETVVEPYKDSLFPEGLHTISAVGNITLIDGKRYIFNKSAFINYLTQRICKSVKQRNNNEAMA